MADPLDSWDKAAAFALNLPAAELSTSYGKPAIKVNGRGFLFTGHESDTSFVLALDLDTVEMLKETDPATFWQSPHYEGWAGVLVRYDSPDPARVRAMVERAHEQALAKGPPRARSRRRAAPAVATPRARSRRRAAPAVAKEPPAG